MPSSNKKIIVVIGATGNQGSSVAHTFLPLPYWHVRAVTRNPTSSASQALAALGAEVVTADLSDPTSLFQAFKGANTIFLNTDFWETYIIAGTAAASGRGDTGKSPGKQSFETEVSHGKNAADVAADIPSLEHLVYSALAPMKRHSKGKYQSDHWDSKATVVDYIENEKPELAKKLSLIYLGAYTTNRLLFPNLDPASGQYKYVISASKEMRLPIIYPKKSTGPFVQALIENEKPGTKLLAYDSDSYLRMEQIVELFTKVTGKEAVLVEVTIEEMHQKFGIPLDVLTGMPYIHKFGYCGGVDGIIEPSELTLKVETKSFENWLGEQDLNKLLEQGLMQKSSVQK
jgi:NAD(P)-dependent dehydrogenase (short-subunit alcohol dehydrogenase family)